MLLQRSSVFSFLCLCVTVCLSVCLCSSVYSLFMFTNISFSHYYFVCAIGGQHHGHLPFCLFAFDKLISLFYCMFCLPMKSNINRETGAILMHSTTDNYTLYCQQQYIEVSYSPRNDVAKMADRITLAVRLGQLKSLAGGR